MVVSSIIHNSKGILENIISYMDLKGIKLTPEGLSYVKDNLSDEGSAIGSRLCPGGAITTDMIPVFLPSF